MSSEPAAPSSGTPSRPRRGGVRISLPIVVFGIALLGCIGYILWVVREVQDQQIQLLSYGFLALGLTFAAIALACVFGMWRAASRAQGGRSFGLALIGGVSGLAAIGSFSVAALMTMLLNS
ncbi:MAG TPA: hypothetical protein VHL56_07850 [Candidatus Limnocylindrales bacterium]|jgi:hypothetical protein|nr:hypothetical protein [Candidatus Limnocylindrales bacterium]